MCPLWPFHLFFIYLLMLGPLWFATCTAVSQAVKHLPVTFEPDLLLLDMEETKQVTVYSGEITPEQEVTLYTELNNDIIIADDKSVLVDVGSSGNWTSMFNVTGNFLGKTQIFLRVRSPDGVKLSSALPVTVTRRDSVIDHVFIGSVAILVSIIYINFGCALDWDAVKVQMKNPIGPIIAFICQFIFMPLISYGIGKLLFSDSVALQLGMFFTGVSPSGGASNMWTVALGGNVHLSIALTTLSMLLAFGMIPFWLFTLGRTIFEKAGLATPYSKIARYAGMLIVPLLIGFVIQKTLPRVSKFLVRCLKPFAVFLILFIIIFATVTHLYLFKLFTWKIMLAGLALPWLGYLAGFILALVAKRPIEDVLAISIETGVQNTGITFFMLGFSLPDPEGDLTGVIPTAVAIMTPIPLLILTLIRRFRVRGKKEKLKCFQELNDENTTVNPSPSESFNIVTNGFKSNGNYH